MTVRKVNTRHRKVPLRSFYVNSHTFGFCQGSHGPGKVMESHEFGNLYSRPGKAMEIRKNCLSHGKVREFQIFPKIVFS